MSIPNISTNNNITCPKCKAILPNDSEFCTACGAKLSDAAAQEKIDRVNFDQLTVEKNLAILKRMVAVEVANKRRKIIKTIIILIIVAIVAVFIVKGIIKNAYRSELRNFATEEMDDSFTNVYADVVSITPEYFVYRYKTNDYGWKIGSGTLWEVVCKCRTIEGKTIWATFFYQRYPERVYSGNEEDYKALKYSADNPLRLIGYVNMPQDVSDDLKYIIGSDFVLDVKETPRHRDT